ncbi:similar to Saccharomyces cerevisiae YPR182W SMX3 Core Sm protein Sm F [Maudiozyma saulgeensis]|uniref:Sm protein F n=1 Tax=Maudiozyma saulgeensis TaxID=1789683 RepID=A0A1X7R2C0_9SACH|nr:similar to Saccharomyces cerevisiae YPR182W SMX3 Core Sm protein Sm F [Kazachstania saulgeensis]
MSDFVPVNPKPFLKDLIDKRVVVTLKFNNTKYKGTLVSSDNYFNVQLKDTEEFVNDKSAGKIGEVFIRCNNVLWIGQDLEAI